jgi:virginiamycin A acetyltransferase
MLKIAKHAVVSPLADIEISKRDSVISIGAFSQVDSFVKIKAAGGDGNITIGEYCYINSGCVLYIGNGITMGDNVLVAANCVFAPVNHCYKDPRRLIREQGFLPSKGGIVIEDDVWIGANVTILDGAYISKGCVIGAQSLVRERTEPYTIYAGNPLKEVGKRTIETAS